MKLCNRRVDGYACRMPRPSRPLLTRLRRHLAVCVWLCALLVLGKSALATACFTDGVTARDRTAVSTIAVQSSAVDMGIAVDDDSAPCWHAGASCHCACAHASPLPVASWTWIPQRNAAVPLPWMLFPAPSPALASAFRPPIA